MLWLIVVVGALVVFIGAGYILLKGDDSSKKEKEKGGGGPGGESNMGVQGLDGSGEGGDGGGSGGGGGGTSGITDPSDPSNYVSSNSGGLDSAPVAPGSPGAYQEIASKPVCDPNLCTGEKVLKSTTRKGDTVEECCRDKACMIDWNPDSNPPGDPDQCKVDGMIFDEDIPNPNGKTNAECCKEDTTSYSRWCVQDVAYKADGTTEKTASPSPVTGGWGDLWSSDRRAGTKDLSGLGSSIQATFNECKKKCDEQSDCSAIWVTTDGRCRLQQPFTTEDFDGNSDGYIAALAGYEKNNQNGTGLDHASAGEFFLKSTFLPPEKRKMTINGEIKIAGIDEDVCPLKYTGIYGHGNWDAGHYPGMHIQPDLNSGGMTGAVKCYNTGTVIEGDLKLEKNSFAPVINKCGQMCEKYDDCEGYWIFTSGNNHGRCCLKTGLTPETAKTAYLTKPTQMGMYMVRVKDGVMGARPWRKSVGRAKSA